MARVIDADALDAQIEKLAKKYESRGRLEAAKDYRFVQTVLQCAPTVDAKPVVHGRWANVQTLGRGCVGFCSNCMTPHNANNATALRIDYRHCRWCGAKMDGDGNG